MYPLRILSVSDHEGLRDSRERLLLNAGYSVASMSSMGALREEIPLEIDIAILGHTVDESSCKRIVARLREAQPNIRILRLTEGYSHAGVWCDGECSVEDGPKEFLARVVELAQKGEM